MLSLSVECRHCVRKIKMIFLTFIKENIYGEKVISSPVVAGQVPGGAEAEVVPGPLEGPRLALHHAGQQHLTVNISDKWKYFKIGTDNISG